jgi:hypothetical protein
MQSRPTAIAALQAVVCEETDKYQYLLSGDASLEITRHFHERGRYKVRRVRRHQQPPEADSRCVLRTQRAID